MQRTGIQLVFINLKLNKIFVLIILFIYHNYVFQYDNTYIFNIVPSSLAQYMYLWGQKI